MSYFDKEKNPYNINKDSHYFALMNPLCCGGLFADGNKHDWVECEIVEDRYKVDDGYKVTLKPLDPNYAYEHFYQSDFIALMEAGHIIEKTNDNLHIEYEEERIPLFGDVYIVSGGHYITT